MVCEREIDNFQGNQEMTKWMGLPFLLEGFWVIHSKSGWVFRHGVDELRGRTTPGVCIEVLLQIDTFMTTLCLLSSQTVVCNEENNKKTTQIH